jgi:hypothetical protein
MRIAMRGLVIGLCLAVFVASVVAQQPGRGPRGKGPRKDTRREGKYKVGDMAPDFKLATLDGKQQVTLSSFRGKRPVALIFGSYT